MLVPQGSQFSRGVVEAPSLARGVDARPRIAHRGTVDADQPQYGRRTISWPEVAEPVRGAGAGSGTSGSREGFRPRQGKSRVYRRRRAAAVEFLEPAARGVRGPGQSTPIPLGCSQVLPVRARRGSGGASARVRRSRLLVRVLGLGLLPRRHARPWYAVTVESEPATACGGGVGGARRRVPECRGVERFEEFLQADSNLAYLLPPSCQRCPGREFARLLARMYANGMVAFSSAPGRAKSGLFAVWKQREVSQRLIGVTCGRRTCGS